MTSALPTASLAIYAALSPVVLFLFFHHWRVGLLGWLYLFAFCSLRIVGGALSMGSTPSSSADIISNVGLSPLLLAAAGILHEARALRRPSDSNRCEWTCVFLFHVLVATGVALVGVGASALTGSASTSTSSDLELATVGISLLVVSWGVLSIGALVSIASPQSSKTAAAFAGTTLLHSVCLALVLVGVRVFYALVVLTTRKPHLNPVTGSLAIRVVLAFLTELLAVLFFVVAGLRTRHGVWPQNTSAVDR